MDSIPLLSNHKGNASHQRGFTLMELAIVLVVIGLIIGGITIGQSMIRQSQLTSVIAQVQRYESAIGTFKKKYNALPGDMANAESFWGSDTNCPNTAANTTYKKATCNGNGDGRVYDDISAGQMYETHRAWQQLANAGLIEGSYTGARGSGFAAQQVPGINSPKLPIKKATLHLMHHYALPANTDLFPFNGHGFNFCDESSTACAAIITGPEAKSLDSKIDDGLPGIGRVITWKPAYLATCASTSDPYTAAYVASDNTTRCALLFQVNTD